MSMLTFTVLGLMLSSLLKPKCSMKAPFPSNCSGWYVILLWLLCEFVTISLGWTLFAVHVSNAVLVPFYLGACPYIYTISVEQQKKTYHFVHSTPNLNDPDTGGGGLLICTEWSVYATSQPMMKGNNIRSVYFWCCHSNGSGDNVWPRNCSRHATQG